MDLIKSILLFAVFGVLVLLLYRKFFKSKRCIEDHDHSKNKEQHNILDKLHTLKSEVDRVQNVINHGTIIDTSITNKNDNTNKVDDIPKDNESVEVTKNNDTHNDFPNNTHNDFPNNTPIITQLNDIDTLSDINSYLSKTTIDESSNNTDDIPYTPNVEFKKKNSIYNQSNKTDKTDKTQNKDEPNNKTSNEKQINSTDKNKEKNKDEISNEKQIVNTNKNKEQHKSNKDINVIPINQFDLNLDI